MPDGNLSLYDITDELLSLQRALIESEGVITDEMAEQYDDLLDAEEDKTEGYIAMIRSFEEEAEAIKREEKRLKKRRKARANAADRLKDTLLMAMEARGETERETTLGKVKVQQASRRGTTVLVDPKDLPPALRRVKVSADKKRIAEEMERIGTDRLRDPETGEVVAQFDEATSYVRIY